MLNKDYAKKYIILHETDKNNLIARNKKNYEKYGYSPAALDWNKGKQDIRFSILTSMLQLKKKYSVLDIGCGFGDLLAYLGNNGQEGGYIGVEIVKEFIDEARSRHSGNATARFFQEDFLADTFSERADIVLASGTFNYKFEHMDNYLFIENCMNKAFQLANEAIAFDFLSDKVDYRYDNAWYSKPEVILEMAYKLSRNVILRNDYMPFEFAVIIFKDDSFEKNDTLFNNYKKRVQRNE